MKKLFVLMGALILVLGLTQCKKPNLPVSNVAEINQHVTITAGYSDANSGGGISKLSMDMPTGSTISLKWDEGDVVNVYQIINGNEIKVSNEGLHMVDKPMEEGKKAEFKGELNGVREGVDLIFRVGNKPTDSIYRSQDGTFEYIKENMLCVEGKSEYHQDGKYYDVTMGLPYAILKVDLSDFAKYRVNLGEGGIKVDVVYYGTKDTIATVGGVRMDTYEHFLAIPTDNAVNAKDSKEETYTFWGNFNLSDFKWTLQQGTFYTGDSGSPFKVHRQFIDMGFPDGILWAVFKLGANDEEGVGDFYAWGETEPYLSQNGQWCDYASHIPKNKQEEGVNDFMDEEGYSFDNYYREGEEEWEDVPYYTIGDSIRLYDSYDAAAAKNPLWRMPTQVEWAQLLDLGPTATPEQTCRWLYVDEGDRKYYYVSSRVNSIDSIPGQGGDIGFYLNGCGYYEGTEHKSPSSDCYLTLNRDPQAIDKAICVNLNGSYVYNYEKKRNRCNGCQIRPVRKLKLKR